MSKQQEEAVVLANERLQAGYYRIGFAAPAIAARVAPGQFVHVQIPEFRHRVLRRPFSVFDVDEARGELRVIYKVVGEGTERLSAVPPGVKASLLGPLGRGFTLPTGQSVIVAGGYGSAATYLLAKRSPVRPLCLLGGRSEADLLLVEEFAALGCRVAVSTDDGSRGHRGLVTDLLEVALQGTRSALAVYACGPNPMLAAVARLVAQRGLDAEISLDHAMCCGVGACFACVVRIRSDAADGWEYVRTCCEGPVFQASRTVWD